jgi:hypothetical protein
VLLRRFDTAAWNDWKTFRNSYNIGVICRPAEGARAAEHASVGRAIVCRLGAGKGRMRTLAHDRAEISAPPAPPPVPQHRLSIARGVVVGILLGLLAWAFLGLLVWMLV